MYAILKIKNCKMCPYVKKQKDLFRKPHENKSHGGYKMSYYCSKKDNEVGWIDDILSIPKQCKLEHIEE